MPFPVLFVPVTSSVYFSGKNEFNPRENRSSFRLFIYLFRPEIENKIFRSKILINESLDRIFSLLRSED